MELVRLLFYRDVQKTFWCDRRIDVGVLLSAVADRLRRVRVVKQIDLDDGWWEDCDLTIVDWCGARFDAQALVEDHGDGRCLCRLRIRSRVISAAVPLMCGLASVALLRWSGAIAWSIGAVVAALIAIGDVMATSYALSTALDRMAAELGLLPMRSSGMGQAERIVLTASASERSAR